MQINPCLVIVALGLGDAMKRNLQSTALDGFDMIARATECGVGLYIGNLNLPVLGRCPL
jgi:hypothetical protein